MKRVLILLLLTTLVFSSCIRRDGESASRQEPGDSEARDGRSAVFDGRGRGSGDEEPDASRGGETQQGGEEAEAPAAGEGEFPPVELPLERISQLPEEPRWARDARIGVLTTSRLSSDPQSTRAGELAREFLEALIQREVVTTDFYDPVTAEGLIERLRAECDGFRVGIADRLPQGEWAVPYRCLLKGNPVPFRGTIYVTLGDRDLIVDGTLEVVEKLDRFEPEALRAQETPF
ncbi:MAG: hypothetical protein ACOCRY_01990 [Alkalispirochaetaceae bacterium]